MTTTTTRARGRYLFAWLPRMALITVAVLAPVIDGAKQAEDAGSGPAVDVVEQPDAVTVSRVALSGPSTEPSDRR